MSAVPRHPGRPSYAGRRMSSEAYLQLGETDERYELIDGVVMMSPSPTPEHSEIALEIVFQLKGFARETGAIRVFADTDLRVSPTVVYQPDIAVYRSDRLASRVERLTLAPDLIVEILSPATRTLDLNHKQTDYARFGVAEYWAVDPDAGLVRAWGRNPRGELEEVEVVGDVVASREFAGFVLNLEPIRAICGKGGA